MAVVILYILAVISKAAAIAVLLLNLKGAYADFQQFVF